jgi:hypothetical protein
MLTLEFKAGLTESPFASGNNFLYGSLKRTGIFYTASEQEWPYLLVAAAAMHPNNELLYSDDLQFGGRHLTPAKVKEILDSSKIPIKIPSTTSGITYLVGKGFLGYFQGDDVKMLLLAVCNRNEKITSLQQIKLIVSKDVNSVEHKRVSSIVRDITNAHSGDLLMTNTIDNYVGHKLLFPSHKTISEKKDFEEKLIKHCITAVKTEIEKSAAAVKQLANAPF